MEEAGEARSELLCNGRADGGQHFVTDAASDARVSGGDVVITVAVAPEVQGREWSDIAIAPSWSTPFAHEPCAATSWGIGRLPVRAGAASITDVTSTSKASEDGAVPAVYGCDAPARSSSDEISPRAVPISSIAAGCNRDKSPRTPPTWRCSTLCTPLAGSTKRTTGESPSDEEDDGTMLWSVLETFFANVPLVVSESDAEGTNSPKAFLRYVDSLSSLKDLLVSLLFKRSVRAGNDLVGGDSDEECDCGLQSSIGLGFGLNFNSRSGNTCSPPRSKRQSASTQRPKDHTPFYLYCQQLENELEMLRRRVPHRRPRSPGVMAGILGEAGLLQDNTVMLLLDFWGLPHEERLAFFCQIASQANEQDASAILHVFLDNGTTQTFLQVWEALQQSPRFQTMIREAKLQLEPATNDVAAASKTVANEAVLEGEDAGREKPEIRHGSSRRGLAKRRDRRSTRFVDLNGITEAYDFNEDEEEGSDEEENEVKSTPGDTHRDSPRFQKITIRERGRLSLSDANDHAGEENQSGRNGTLHRSDHSRRQLKTPIDRESLPLLDLLHHDLTEIIKMEDGPEAHIMDAVWQLLEALDGHRMHDSRSGYHRRHFPIPTPSAIAQPQPQQVVNPRAALRTPLSAEQQFLMKLDQLQSMLSTLGDVRVHTMSTETITGAYRRIPVLAKLFAALSDTSLSAAGVDTATGGMPKVVSNYGKAQHLANSWQGGGLKDKTLTPLPVTPEQPVTKTEDNVREDVEAMGLLLVKFSKFVRSLAPLVDNEDSAPSSESRSDDVLVVMDLADKLENAGALAEVPSVLGGGGGGKRRFSLAVDRELPIILAVQSLVWGNDLEEVSRLIATSIESRVMRVQVAAADEKFISDEEDIAVALEEDEEVMKMEEDEEVMKMEEDEEVMKIVKNLRRSSGKAAQEQVARDQVQFQKIQGRAAQQHSSDDETATLRPGKGDIPTNIKNATATRGIKLFSVDILLRIINQGLLSRWSLGTFLGGSKHRVEIPKREFKIRIAIAISTVQEALRERFGAYARGMDALAERIRAKALSRDEEFIRENDLLILCVDEFGSQRALLEKVLGAVYLAGDINGDGSLEFDEFASVVTHLSPTVDDGFMQKVFEAAHDYSKPNRISFARFLDVILLERVLNPAPLIARAKTTTTGSAGGTNSAGSGGSSHPRTSTIKAAAQDEQEEEYQFELLRETWTHDREAVQQVLQTSITHSPTAKTLSFRVAFLDQLLSRRVDSKTAWLCHRQIMREIARYQHLDADQIAGLRSKELQFKKTVRAIRNAQWLRTIFAVPSATPDATGDEATAADVPNTDALDPPQVPASYTAAVRLSLDIQAPGATNVADVAALENELRETFLERADEGAIEDYMAAMQHLRRVSITQQSLQLVLESREESSLMRTEGAVPEGSEESDTEEEDDESKEDGAGYDGEEVAIGCRAFRLREGRRADLLCGAAEHGLVRLGEVGHAAHVVALERGLLALGRDVDRVVRVEQNAVHRVSARVEREVVDHGARHEVADAALDRHATRRHGRVVVLEELLGHAGVHVLHEHVQRALVGAGLLLGEVVRERAGLLVDIGVPGVDVPVVVVQRAQHVGRAVREVGAKERHLGLEARVRVLLLLRERVVLARVVDPLDLEAEPLREGLDEGQALEQRRGAARLEHDLVRVDEHGALGQHVGVDVLVAGARQDLALAGLEHLVQVGARHLAQAARVAHAELEVDLEVLLGALERVGHRVGRLLRLRRARLVVVELDGFGERRGGVGLLRGVVARANVEEAREDGGRVNNIVAAGKKRVDQRHEQRGGLARRAGGGEGPGTNSARFASGDQRIISATTRLEARFRIALTGPHYAVKPPAALERRQSASSKQASRRGSMLARRERFGSCGGGVSTGGIFSRRAEISRVHYVAPRNGRVSAITERKQEGNLQHWTSGVCTPARRSGLRPASTAARPELPQRSARYARVEPPQ
ncbi:hypothetical protein ON010_g7696 [Phytophthora cinnamomi]|nr:hypothetical protein ON010_g7696 [Phytophthora cinnamomi]